MLGEDGGVEDILDFLFLTFVDIVLVLRGFLDDE